VILALKFLYLLKFFFTFTALIFIQIFLKVNKSLPMNYDFEFAIDEVTNVNDKGLFYIH